MARKGLRKAAAGEAAPSKKETSTKSARNPKNPKKRKLEEEIEEIEQDEDEEEYEDEEEDEGDFRIAVGLDTNDAADLSDVLQLAAENHLHFACVPLFHPRIRLKSSGSSSSSALITRSDMALDHADWVIEHTTSPTELSRHTIIHPSLTVCNDYSCTFYHSLH